MSKTVSKPLKTGKSKESEREGENEDAVRTRRAGDMEDKLLLKSLKCLHCPNGLFSLQRLHYQEPRIIYVVTLRDWSLGESL
ncbi:unnamed protein product [Pleuronectes platessa]|uniref:Uncharacterized protein n=1 Tax=Pleuronectes platessa TaxID=8262 RepID=A0A9N7V1Y8_PLEPL|nr:unnamed protein product [Pleuronectes platessa]